MRSSSPLAAAVVATVRYTGGLQGPLAPLVFLYMLTPALACVLARLLTRRAFSYAGHRLGKLPWYPYAWTLSLAMIAAFFLTAYRRPKGNPQN